MYNFRHFIIVVCFFGGCLACNVDWAERLKSANQKASEYFNSGVEEHFKDALKMYDGIVKHSSEYRNQALLSKSIFLGKTGRFEEAISTAMQIPDTAGVFASFRTKCIHLNAILADKALHNKDLDTYNTCLKIINEELDVWLTSRSDSICRAICSPIESIYNNEDIVALLYYIENMKIYDGTM